MPERYPDDAVLLAMTQDAPTGAEYIATGQSPYHLAFRRLVHRLLAASGRANDLRVYQDGDLTVGVRAGRTVVNHTAQNFTGVEGVAIASGATTHLWLNDAGALQSSTAGLPADRTTFVPLAEVVAGGSQISSITDLRSEALCLIPDLPFLGVNATAARINAAIDGTSAGVDAAALNTLTGGPASTADSEHRHLQVYQDANSELAFTLINDNGNSNANIALRLSLPNRLAADTDLLVNVANGYVSQRYDGQSYNLVGTVHAQAMHEGDLTASITNKLVGVVPIDGVVSDVILCLATNIESDTSTDGVSATAKVNGIALTTTDPAVTDAAGSGFRSTAQGDGVAAIVKSDGTQNVSRGDVLTVDLTRTVTGTVSTQPADIVALIVIRAAAPE